MTKPRERTEKKCLNCDAELLGLYCHACGQKNIEPRRPLWEIPWAFVEDIINVDGKFFKSVKRLCFNPGYLGKAYIKGKRHSFNDPVRIYLVTSFLFFIITGFVFNKLKNEIDLKVSEVNSTVLDTVVKSNGIHGVPKDNGGLFYDSNSTADSTEFKDNAIKTSDKIKKLVDESSSRLPYLLWFSLPIFALILKLFYVRRKIFYWDHLIFSLGIYSFHFLLISLSFSLFYLIRWIFNLNDTALLNRLIALSTAGIGLSYMFFALKNFYGQSYFKTFIKFILFNIITFFLFIFELIAFVYVITLITSA